MQRKYLSTKVETLMTAQTSRRMTRTSTQATLRYTFSDMTCSPEETTRAIFDDLQAKLTSVGIVATVLSVGLSDDICSINYTAVRKGDQTAIAKLAHDSCSLVLKEVYSLAEGQLSLSQWVDRSRRAQGIPRYVSDPEVLQQVANMLRPRLPRP